MSKPQWETPEISILREARQAQTGLTYNGSEGSINNVPATGPSGAV